MGPAFSPVVAGIMTQYAHGNRGSWRAFQYLLAAMGSVCFLLILFILPETIPVRGIDRLRQEKPNKRWLWVWLNPLRPLKLLRHRNVLAMSITSSFVLSTTYCLLVPLTVTLGPRYGITNEAILGTLYLSQGAGEIVGSRISGYVSDITVAKWIQRRSSKFIPEDRLRSSLVAGGVVMPLSLLAIGLTMQFWTSIGGLALSLVLLFISGVGVMGVLAVCNTYLVDVMQDRSAEVIATNNAVRYMASAGVSAGVLPLIQTIGIAPTNAIASSFALAGFGLICATIKYGEGWREVGDAQDIEDAQKAGNVKGA
ncbi:MFS general substrate transporter [Ramaria rubella]|nr:MFS general substrate transporter [Ramaria rubella]